MKKRLGILFSIFIMSFVLISCTKSDKYTVTFEPNGGSFVESIKDVEKGSKINKPKDPSKDGHTFEQWYKEEELTNEWKFETDVVESDIKLYAKWTKDVVIKEEVKVTFNFGYTGSPAPKIITIKGGTKVTAEKVIERENFEFLGWFLTGSDTAFDFDQVVNDDITLVAKWRTTLETWDVTLDLNYDNKTEVVTVVDGAKLDVEEPIRSNYIFIRWEFNNEPFDLETVITKDITLKAVWIEDTGLVGTPITTQEQLIELFTEGGNGDYYLAVDLDMSNVEYVGSNALFTGRLNGNAKKITNFNVTTAGNKTGAMFGTLSGGAVIENITFMNSSVTGPGEGVGFITFLGFGNVTYNNLTFINVSLNQTSGSYAGLLFAENANNDSQEVVKVSNITIKNNNNNSIDGSQHVGVLVGHVREKMNVDFKNIYVETNVSASSVGGTLSPNAAVLVGRLQGTGSTFNIDNIVYKGNISASKEAAVLIGQSNKEAVANTKNIFINNTNVFATGGNDSETQLLFGRQHASFVSNITNAFHTSSVTVKRGDKISPITDKSQLLTNVTKAWFDVSDFDKDFFIFEDNDIMPNIDLGPVEVEGIIVNSNSFNEVFVKDIDTVLDLSNLEVSVSYSDGSTKVLTKEEYAIDQSSFDASEVGSYDIIIKHESLEVIITINVVEINHLVAYIIDQNIVFKSTNTITEASFSKLVVQAILTNDDVLLLKNNELEFDLSNITNEAGTYKVTVKYKEVYAVEFTITVVEDLLVADENNEVRIIVDANAADSGKLVDNVLNVQTVKEAFEILALSNLTDDVIKKVHLKEGTYFEKVILNIPNVHLIGESQDSTIIDYNAGSGGRTPTLAEWGTQGSSTFTLGSKGTGFIAYNLTFSNSFDYYGSTLASKQAVALVTQADKVIFHKVSFLGLQDTLYAKDGRRWYLDVYVEGIVDYIFGNGGPAYFENSKIHTLNRQGTSANAVITAQKGVGANGKSLVDYGYVFVNNKFTAPEGMTSKIDLGRPWDKNAAVAYVNNEFNGHISEAGWTDMSGNKAEDARFFEFGNKIVDVLYQSTRGTQLTEQETSNYISKDVVFAQKNGEVDFGSAWDYKAQLALLNLPK